VRGVTLRDDDADDERDDEKNVPPEVFDALDGLGLD
jgi:hypothetical protein